MSYSHISPHSLGAASSSGGGTPPNEDDGCLCSGSLRRRPAKGPHGYITRNLEMAVITAELVESKGSVPKGTSPCVSSNDTRARITRSKAHDTDSSTKDLLDETPEARKRRLLELKLLHQYMDHTSRTISIRAPGPTEQLLREIWVSGVPRMAFNSDSLLYSINCVAAMHLAKMEPQNLEAQEASKTYLGLTIRMHGEEVAQLNKNNADVAFVTSCILRILVFAILQERELKPYAAPVQWLSMTNKAGAVFRAAWSLVQDNPNSLARALMIANKPEWTENMAIFGDKRPRNLESVFGEKNRQCMAHLLERDQANEKNELWNAEIKDTYEMAIRFIGGICLAVTAKADAADILRLLILFPIVVEKRFVDLVSDLQPRALVVLAHYFALLARFREVWWVGDTGQREIHAIQSELPVEWQHFLTWPLQAMQEEPLHAG